MALDWRNSAGGGPRQHTPPRRFGSHVRFSHSRCDSQQRWIAAVCKTVRFSAVACSGTRRARRLQVAGTSLNTSLGENYRVVGELGRGSMGVVYSAFDEILQRKVAIKLIRKAFRTDAFRKRFKFEARAMALVSHPNVVSIHAFGEHQASPFIVMELVDGQSLDSWRGKQPSPPDRQTSLSILDQICDGVIAIHEAGTIHRDIKPSNILLDRTHLRARISDFGLAVHDGEGANDSAGTPGYIAPELQFGDRTEGATAKSDVYSLGCVAYELLVGAPPFFADHASGLAVQHASFKVPVPSDNQPNLRAFDEVLLSALVKDPNGRTATVEEFRQSLVKAQAISHDPARILVAEDDPNLRDVLNLFLRRAFPGAEVECVADGWTALQSFDQRPASVVIVDLSMPVLDGMAVTERLRSGPNAGSVGIIVLTGSGGPREWQRLSSLGADRFLVKPVNLDDLVSTIQHVAGERSKSAGLTKARASVAGR